MIDEQDITKLKTVFATKEDLMVTNGKVDNLEGKVDNLEGKVDNLEGKVDNLEGKLDDFIDTSLKTFATKTDLKVVDTKIDNLTEMVQQLIVSMDGVGKKINFLNTEYSAIVHQTDRHDKWIKETANHVGLELSKL